jgi:VWFA-related protein
MWPRFAALVLAALLSALLVSAEGGTVRFVSPRHNATVLGPTTIEVAVEGSPVERVEIAVDGKPLATLTAPPFRAPWDAGDASTGHTLTATAYFTDGTHARAAVATSRLLVQQVEEVALVNLYAVVTDEDGRYVNDLSQKDFRIQENGRTQTIERFSADRKPLKIALVIDASYSMTRDGKLEAAREASRDFVSALGPGDECMLVTFNDSVDVAHELTSNKSALLATIDRTEAVGGTALYDALFKTADRLEKVDGRKVLVLLSDGRDEANNGLEPGSLHTLDEALDRALRNEVMIFAIGVGRGLEEELDFYRRRSLASIFRTLADTTGGRVIFSKSSGKLTRAFEAVAEDLRHQYSLAYTSDDPRHDGAWREIRLTTATPGLRVSGRRGYFAPKSGGNATQPAGSSGAE